MKTSITNKSTRNTLSTAEVVNCMLAKLDKSADKDYWKFMFTFALTAVEIGGKYMDPLQRWEKVAENAFRAI